MKSRIKGALLGALAVSFGSVTCLAADNESKAPRKPAKRASMMVSKKEHASTGSSAPRATPAVAKPFSTEASKPTPLHRDDLTLEEMQRYHQ